MKALTANQRLARTVSEAEFQRMVIDLAHLHHWRVAHFRAAQKADGSWVTPVAADGKGFPDLVMVRPTDKRVIFAELKSELGRLRPDQQAWISDLLRCPGVETYTWKPSDLPQVAKVLR